MYHYQLKKTLGINLGNVAKDQGSFLTWKSINDLMINEVLSINDLMKRSKNFKEVIKGKLMSMEKDKLLLMLKERAIWCLNHADPQSIGIF